MIETSIIVPTFNSAKYAQTLIDSILNQTIDNYEVIIVDNHSNDDTINAIKKKNNNDKRFRYFSIFNNGVIAKSRNHGIDNARGNYLAFHDSDDSWVKDKLEVSILYLKNYDFTYHRVRVSNNKNIFDRRVMHSYQLSNYKNNVFIDLMTKGNPIDLSSVVCKKEIFNDVRFTESKKFITVEDFECWIQLSIKGVKFKRINKVLGHYFLSGFNTSLTFSNSPYKFMHIANKYKNMLKDEKDIIFSKNIFRYFVAVYVNNKKTKRKYFSYLFFSKIHKLKLKIFIRFILSFFL